MGRLPRVERLAIQDVSRIYDGGPIARDEAVTKLCLDPIMAPEHAGIDAHFWSAALVRTATVFVIDAEDWKFMGDAIQSEFADETGRVYTGVYDTTEMYAATSSVHPYDLIDLPPLPFPRVAIEIHDDSNPGWHPSIYGDNVAEHPLVVINETVPHERWDVYFPGIAVVEGTPEWENQLSGAAPLFSFQMGAQGAWEIGSAAEMVPTNTAYEQLGQDAVLNDKTHPRAARFWRRIVLDLVDAITADRVPHEPVWIPRGTRRAFERRYKIVHPNVYYVNLDSAGEDPRRADSGRVLTVRHLVRGHWRHHAGGARTCSNCGRVASWIKPYVRGPVGAPWKGRPVYLAGADPCRYTREEIAS